MCFFFHKWGPWSAPIMGFYMQYLQVRTCKRCDKCITRSLEGYFSGANVKEFHLKREADEMISTAEKAQIPHE